MVVNLEKENPTNGGVRKWGYYPNSWMIYTGKYYQNGTFGGTPILGNHHLKISWWT